MPEPARTIVCVVRCPSPEAARAAGALAARRTALDATIEDVALSYPGGVESRASTVYRLGDLFDAVEVGGAGADGRSFGIVFHVRDDANRYWKDAAVRILRAIERETAVAVRILSVTS